MSKEIYQEIKRISGEQLRELLSDLDNVFDLGTGTLIGNSYMTSTDCWFGIYCDCVVTDEIWLFFSRLEEIKFLMNHLLATYIDLIQSVGFIFLMTLAVFITRKLFLDNRKDNYIEVVKIKVEEWIIC